MGASCSSRRDVAELQQKKYAGEMQAIWMEGLKMLSDKEVQDSQAFTSRLLKRGNSRSPHSDKQVQM